MIPKDVQIDKKCLREDLRDLEKFKYKNNKREVEELKEHIKQVHDTNI